MTVGASGQPRPVPIAYAFVDDGERLVLYSALDEKRKTVADLRDLARVRDIGTRPRVAILVDRWDEDWSRLAWVRLEGTAVVLDPPTDRPQGGVAASASIRRSRADAQQQPAGVAAETGQPEHALAVGLLRQRYPQYATHNLEARPVIRIEVERVTGWRA